MPIRSLILSGHVKFTGALHCVFLHQRLVNRRILQWAERVLILLNTCLGEARANQFLS